MNHTRDPKNDSTRHTQIIFRPALNVYRWVKRFQNPYVVQTRLLIPDFQDHRGDQRRMLSTHLAPALNNCEFSVLYSQAGASFFSLLPNPSARQAAGGRSHHYRYAAP